MTRPRFCMTIISGLLLFLAAGANLAASSNGAQFVSQSVPSELKPGESKTVSITMKNVGSKAWTRSTGYKLGTQNPQDNRRWTGRTRVYLSTSNIIRPGQTKTFSFNITAPQQPGTYNFQWRMVHEGVEWFGAFTPNVRITVKVPSNRAQFVSQSVPSSLLPGETRTVSVVMKNTGGTTWSRAGRYKLGTQNPQDNRRWTGRTRVYLSTSNIIRPGQTKTFSFNITAPQQPGTYNFQWRMVHEGVEWFGNFTPVVAIDVTDMGSGPPPGSEPPPGGRSFPIRPGLMPATNQESSSFDIDRDGIPQVRELRLAQAFFPTVWFDDGEDCALPGGSRAHQPNAPGRLVFRVRPHPANRDFIAITYALLFHRDCGENVIFDGKFNAHPGDVEAFAITLGPNPACDHGYGIYSIRTWAHEGVPVFEKIQTTFHPLTCKFGFSVDPTGRSDIVLSSENKHGNYLSDRTCDRSILFAENCDLDFTLGDVNSWVGLNTGERHAPINRDLGVLGFPGEEMWARRAFCGSLRGSGCPGPVEEKLDLISPAAATTPAPPASNVAFVSQSVPTELQPGETRSVTIAMKNIGSQAWTAAAGYKLGTQNPQDNTLWTGDTRVLLAPSDVIQPGQTKTFVFPITAPATPGTHNFQWRMVHEGVEWFGASTPNVRINVIASSMGNASQFVSQSVPTRLAPGETSNVTVTMKNTGSVPWTHGAGYKLGTQNPQANTLWTGATRVPLSLSDVIQPGETKRFTFPITAPITPGLYDFQWRTVHEGVEWFGDFTQNVRIDVSAAEAPPPEPTSDPASAWEADDFDNLSLGRLHRQNGWLVAAANRAGAIVSAGGGADKFLTIDPGPGATIVMSKNVPNQRNGRHLFSFRVMVTGATAASVAKIEVNTKPIHGWNKKFQIFFGSSMRINYGADGRAVTFVPATEMGRWYNIICDLDFASGLVDVWVDDVIHAENILVHAGPVTALSLSGWDRPGSVHLDDILGSQIEPE